MNVFPIEIEHLSIFDRASWVLMKYVNSRFLPFFGTKICSLSFSTQDRVILLQFQLHCLCSTSGQQLVVTWKTWKKRTSTFVLHLWGKSNSPSVFKVIYYFSRKSTLFLLNVFAFRSHWWWDRVIGTLCVLTSTGCWASKRERK